MASRAITRVSCPCGHCGSIVEGRDDDCLSHWYLATLRDRSHKGLYDGPILSFRKVRHRVRRVGKSLGLEHATRREHRAVEDPREGPEIARRI